VRTGRPVGVGSVGALATPAARAARAAEFIDIAEETGLIVPIGAGCCAARRALQTPANARRAGLAISVNVSAHQFKIRASSTRSPR